MNKYMVFMGIGFELVGIVLAGLFLANELEKRYPSQGLITVAVIVLGLIGWLIHLVYVMKSEQNQ